ncbi:MAG: IS200/IS605 family transposase [Symploca sp. SIO2C1]|nr:IS200/IS605 family transposase [Symploca sp. SIO2C1]
MSNQKKDNYSNTHRAVYNLTVHIVFVTKYRRKVITGVMLTRLADVFQSIAAKWDAKLLEFNGESDHVHLLISYPPHKLLSNLIANLKSTSSKTMWKEFASEVSATYNKRVFWKGSYFVASCGGVTIEQLKKYVHAPRLP